MSWLFVLLGDKDAYNFGNPDDDASLVFLPDIRDSLYTLHFGVAGMEVVDNTGVDDDLMAIPFDPCDGTQNGVCEQQAGPSIVPDVVALDLDTEPGFPNGRRPQEPVMDIILAIVLLELSAMQPSTLFLDIDNNGTPGPSINPIDNDVPFPDGFPYLAAAHE